MAIPRSSPNIFASLQLAKEGLAGGHALPDTELKASINLVLAQAAQLPDTIELGDMGFIVLEGLDACGKSTLAKMVASTNEFEILKTPPSSIAEHRTLFDESGQDSLRRAFYFVGNYLALKELKSAEKSVVFDRFYFSTVAYAMAAAYKAAASLPPASDDCWCWPADLPKPMLVVYVSVSHEEQCKRLKHRAAELKQPLTDEEAKMIPTSQLSEVLERAYESLFEANQDIPVLKLDSSSTSPTALRDQVFACLEDLRQRV
eukprot:m.293634 g.293634  ORF g.293634 m.293634 type:complete len:260 (+) comp27751_c0_seq1:75-854(+)